MIYKRFHALTVYEQRENKTKNKKEKGEIKEWAIMQNAHKVAADECLQPFNPGETQMTKS